MKYIDTSTVVDYILKAGLEYTDCDRIIKAIKSGKESVLFSILNISELFYVLQREKLSLNRIQTTIEDFVKLPGVHLMDIPTELGLEGIKLAEKYRIDFTDAIIYLLMKKHGIKEIYSLDRHFDKFRDIQRLTGLKV